MTTLLFIHTFHVHLFHYREWDFSTRTNSKIFAEENQANILPSISHHKKRGRENTAQHAQQEAQQLPLPLISANNRPRIQARHKEEKSAEKDEPILGARIVLAPAPIAAAPSANALAAAGTPQDAIDPEVTMGESIEDPIMALSEKCLYTIKHRKEVLSRLDKQGKIPSFLEKWMTYCTSLSAYECPDYDKLRALLETAPKVAHIAAALRAKQPTLIENEE